MENPVVTIEMENGGIITAELYPDVAPQSVYNFISLANSGFYDGLQAGERGGRQRIHRGPVCL